MSEPLTIEYLTSYEADHNGDIDLVFKTTAEPTTIRIEAKNLPTLIAHLFGAMEFFIEHVGQPEFPRAIEPESVATASNPGLVVLIFMLGKMRIPVALKPQQAAELASMLKRLPRDAQRLAKERAKKAH